MSSTGKASRCIPELAWNAPPPISPTLVLSHPLFLLFPLFILFLLFLLFIFYFSFLSTHFFVGIVWSGKGSINGNALDGSNNSQKEFLVVPNTLVFLESTGPVSLCILSFSFTLFYSF